MSHLILKDVPAEKIHDLTFLLETNKEIKLGRPGYGNLISLGEGLVFNEGSTLEQNEATFNVSTVSRHHATITCPNGYVYIKDENSSNGTFINRKKLPNVGYVLKDGYTLFFGAYGPVQVYEK